MSVNAELSKLIEKFEPYGEFYLVGGCVRNQYLNIPIKDYDIATPLTPTELQGKLPGYVKHINSAQAYPVVLWDGHEIATFRTDGKDRKDAEGIKLGCSIYKDAMRRDFTMNAIYYKLTKHSARVVDPTQRGLNDIKNRIIRFVGNPEERIKEDPIRIFRAYRFLSQLSDFVVEIETEKALKRALQRVSFK